MSTDYVIAQDCPDSGHPKIPRPVGSTCRMFGQVKLETYQSPNVWANITTLIQGEAGDVVSRPNIIVRNDVLKFTVGLNAPNNFIPEDVGIEITSYSTLPFKYAKDHKLTISADGLHLVEGDTEVLSSTSIGERFRLRMRYSDLVVLAGAKKVALKLGSTNVELSPEVIRALQALIESTKELKPRPPQTQRSCV